METQSVTIQLQTFARGIADIVVAVVDIYNEESQTHRW